MKEKRSVPRWAWGMGKLRRSLNWQLIHDDDDDDDDDTAWCTCRAMGFLTTASPCALALVPLAYVSAIGAVTSRSVMWHHPHASWM